MRERDVVVKNNFLNENNSNKIKYKPIACNFRGIVNE